MQQPASIAEGGGAKEEAGAPKAERGAALFTAAALSLKKSTPQQEALSRLSSRVQGEDGKEAGRAREGEGGADVGEREGKEEGGGCKTARCVCVDIIGLGRTNCTSTSRHHLS